jgi:hypothetical protein
MRARFNIKNMALLAWGGVNALLALAIGSELGWGEHLRQPMPVPVVHPSAPVEIAIYPDFRLPEREKAYAQTLARPLFVPSRLPAPPAPPPPPPPPPTMKKGQFQLMGTIVTDEVRIAVVREISSGKDRQVVQGFTINGLQLELVEDNRIVFTQYTDREEIRLKIQRSPRPVAAPPVGQATNPRVSEDTPQQTVRPARRARVQGASAGQAGSSAPAPAPVPVPVPAPPQTMEERKVDPVLKDFYKQ